MTYDLPALPRIPSAYEEDIVNDALRRFSQLTTWRNTFAAQYEEIAELIDPNSRNTFYVGNFNWPGQKKTDRQVDASGMMALSRFAAICDSLLTPRNMTWHGLAADDDYVMKDRATRLWFEQATRVLFRLRYAAHAGFTGQNIACYRNLGAYGTPGMFIDEFDNTNYPWSKGIRYKAIPMGELFIQENHQGLVDGFIRWFKLTARQAYQKWGDIIPEVLHTPLKADSEFPYNFIHCVWPRSDYDPERLDSKGKIYGSYYISLEGRCLLSEGGYRKFPAAISRYSQAPGEVYGRSPAMDVLPSLKTLNAQKKTLLKVGHRAGDPVLLTADDGIVDLSLRPGALNKGGVTADGRELVKVLPTGDPKITKEMMAEEKSLINDAFFVTLFQILTETPQMTATEVIERTNEKGILLAPTVGNQQSGYLGPMIERELDVASAIGELPPQPPRLKEAKGSYVVVYSSPLSRAMRSQEAAGFIRTVETVKELVNITQDASLLDPFDFDTAIPAIAEIQNVPESWMADIGKMQQKRQARAQAQKKRDAITAAPAQAAMMKAQAVQAKAGLVPPAQAPAAPGAPLPQQLQGA
jgi:hypothetical protein